MDSSDVADFRLYDARTAQLLGAHHTVQAALAAADEHSLSVLVASGDWVVVEHLIAHVDERGRIDVASEVTHLGPADDVEGCRTWPHQLPGREGSSPF